MSAYETDYAAIGLPSEHGQNAFTHCPPRSTRHDSHETPAKRWPKSKKEQMPSALMTDEERRILKDNKASHFNVHIPTVAEGDRTASICGRGV